MYHCLAEEENCPGTVHSHESILLGIDSISMDMKEKKLTVIGTVDPVNVVSKLRKYWQTDIITVGPAKEPEKKEEAKPEEPKKEEAAKPEEAKKEEAKTRGGKEGRTQERRAQKRRTEERGRAEEASGASA